MDCHCFRPCCISRPDVILFACGLLLAVTRACRAPVTALGRASCGFLHSLVATRALVLTASIKLGSYSRSFLHHSVRWLVLGRVRSLDLPWTVSFVSLSQAALLVMPPFLVVQPGHTHSAAGVWVVPPLKICVHPSPGRHRSLLSSECSCQYSEH